MATARPGGKTDLVWALHTFEAENDDELAFSAGERIIVLERDDQYGDGWFQVRPLSLPDLPGWILVRLDGSGARGSGQGPRGRARVGTRVGLAHDSDLGRR